jgi:hypothetical protein
MQADVGRVCASRNPMGTGPIREKAQCHVLIRAPAVGRAAIAGKTTLEKTFGQFLWVLVAEFDAENGVGHSNRLFGRFGIPFSEPDLERYWDS